MTSSAITRRLMLTGASAVLLPALPVFGAEAQTQLAAIERQTGGRLGVAVHDTASGARLFYRPNERFAMCSTFKFLAVAALLSGVDRGRYDLSRRIAYGPGDLLAYAPVTKAHVAQGGMTLAALCAAAIEWSDNTAANLMLKQLGGPQAVTNYARGLRDPLTRLDRTEPTLNTAIPGDPRDTTSPAAMLADMNRILTGDALSRTSRQQLLEWMLACRTADNRIRAGLPKGWRVGSKTGSGAHGTRNEIAIVIPPGRKPILAAVYLTNTKNSGARETAHAAIGKLIAERFG